MGVTLFQLLLVASFATAVFTAAAAIGEAAPGVGGVGNVEGEGGVVQQASVPNPNQMMQQEQQLARPKRYLGWGRRPGMRYSKATSAFDIDSTFNKLYNRFEKRGQAAPEAPISSFRELRMKQKVPNIQLLLPHLFNRNNRVTTELDQGQDFGVVELSPDDTENLLYFFEDYGKNSRNEQQQ